MSAGKEGKASASASATQQKRDINPEMHRWVRNYPATGFPPKYFEDVNISASHLPGIPQNPVFDVISAQLRLTIK